MATAVMVSIRTDKSQREIILIDAGVIFESCEILTLNYTIKPVVQTHNSTLERLLLSPTQTNLLNVVDRKVVYSDIIREVANFTNKTTNWKEVNASIALSLGSITTTNYSGLISIMVSIPITREALTLHRITPLNYLEEGELVRITDISEYLISRNSLPYAILNRSELDSCVSPDNRTYICQHFLSKLGSHSCERDIFTGNNLLRCVLHKTAETCVIHRLSPTRFFLNNQRNVSIGWSCPGANVTQYVQVNTWIDINPSCNLTVQGVSISPPGVMSDRFKAVDGDERQECVQHDTHPSAVSLELQPPGFALDTWFARFFGAFGARVQMNAERVADAYEVAKIMLSPWTYIKLVLGVMATCAVCLLGRRVWENYTRN